ncbi:Tyrosine kinase-like (TKL) protein, partial [Toxoplasma gondii TgCatPRC2]
ASGASAFCGCGGAPASVAATELDLDAFFDFREKLGKGSFGEVWRVRIKSEGRAVGAARRKPRERKRSREEQDAGVREENAVSEEEERGKEVHSGEERAEAPWRRETDEDGEADEAGERGEADEACRGDSGEPAEPEYALKLVPKSEENLPEAEIMRSYSHPRVVPFLGVFEGFQMLEDRSKKKVKNTSLCFLMDIADQSLESLLEEHEKANTCLDVEFILTILLDTARGMNYLHSPSATKPHLLHRDLKPANILLK